MRRYLLIIVLIVLGSAAVVYDGMLNLENARVQRISEHLLERVYSRALREYYVLLTDARQVLEEQGTPLTLAGLQQSTHLGNYIMVAVSAAELQRPGDWLLRLGLTALDSQVSAVPGSAAQPALVLDVGEQLDSPQRIAVRLEVLPWLSHLSEDQGLGAIPLMITWQGNTLSGAEAAPAAAGMTVFTDFMVPEFSLYLSHREIDDLFQQKITAALATLLVTIPEFILLFWLWRQYFRGRRLQQALEKSHRDLADQRYAYEIRNRLLQHKSAQVKGLNEDLEQARRRMELSERLAALGEISAGIAHEINNPVAYSLSNLTTLKEDVEALMAFIQRLDKASDQLDEQSPFYRQLLQDYQQLEIPHALRSAPERIQDITEGIERVSRIIQDMRKLSRTGGDKNFTQLNSDLNSVLNIARSRLKNNIELVTELAELPPVYCNASQISQVVLNILINAIQAIGDQPGGRITLTQTLHDGQLQMQICDNGPGMDEITASRIFEPFFTTKAEGEGTGMGLALCYQLIEEHQGRIDLQTQPGEGTCFTIWLPLKPLPTSAGEEQHAE